jgi:hypothetical protein
MPLYLGKLLELLSLLPPLLLMLLQLRQQVPMTVL